MAENKKGLKAIEITEEIEEEDREQKKTVWRRLLVTGFIMVLLFVLAELYIALRSFSSFTILSESDRADSEAVTFATFGGSVLKYSNDGAVLTDGQNKQIWNQSYEMTTPRIAMCDDYLAIYDRGGIDLYIMSKSQTVRHIEMSSPIQAVSIANQGTVAVMTKGEKVTQVHLYDKSANELASGEFYEEKSGIPIDIALSYDGKKLAVDMVDVRDGNLKSTISFYNFGSVGQNEINNNVGNFAYSDMFIPEIEFVSDERMIALGDNEVIVFEGSEKLSVVSEILLKGQVKSVIYNEKNVGIITENVGEESGNHFALYDMKGKNTMDTDIAIAYSDVYFLENGEICFTGESECCIYSTHGIKKFAYVFEKGIYRILSQGKGAQYIFVLDDSTQEVRLK